MGAPSANSLGVFTKHPLCLDPGLSLVVGLVLYISSINDEMLNRTKDTETYFNYKYGWSFAFAAISFLLTEVNLPQQAGWGRGRKTLCNTLAPPALLPFLLPRMCHSLTIRVVGPHPPPLPAPAALVAMSLADPSGEARPGAQH